LYTVPITLGSTTTVVNLGMPRIDISQRYQSLMFLKIPVAATYGLLVTPVKANSAQTQPYPPTLPRASKILVHL
jgi:hypothetical protein